ncbi:SURF1 family protein, partial [Streptomyces sp. SID8455]|nr:SURF1 family protein [Streptomyces sp. SID8455]
STRAAKPLDELLPVDKVTSGRPAMATGTYGDQFLVPGRELDDRQGFYVLNLLRTEGGKALPVVRGWLPGTASGARVPAAPQGV